MNHKKWIFIAIFLFGIGLVFGLVTPTSVINLLSEDIAALQNLRYLMVALVLLVPAAIIEIYITPLLLT